MTLVIIIMLFLILGFKRFVFYKYFRHVNSNQFMINMRQENQYWL